MIPLHTLKVASPCHADWDEMQGDAQVRFCGGCRKSVYNLSEMTHDEAQALVNRLEGRLCVRFYARADGTLLTQDCPVGLRAVRRKLVKKLSYAAAVLLSCASGLLCGMGPAQAVTHAKKQAVRQHSAKPPRGLTSTAGVPSLPRPHLMGKIAPPIHTTKNPGQFPLPQPPGGMGGAYMGGMQAGLAPTMGAPLPAPKR